MQIKSLLVNKNRSNTNGVFSIAGRKFFYKILSLEDYKKEIGGYTNIKKYYPVAGLIYSSFINHSKNGLLIFEYEETIGKNRGLLIDIFANSRSYNDDIRQFNRVISIYKRAFAKSFKYTSTNCSDVFFGDRIELRLKKYYDKKFCGYVKRIGGFDFKEEKIDDINFEGIISSLEKYFSANKKRHSVISQCDPNDLNIGLKPIILDYLAGGYNPLMAEFATLFWYCIAQGNYFSVQYNKKEYQDHPNIFKNVDLVTLSGKKLFHEINPKRKKFLIHYMEEVITPLMGKTRNYCDWYKEFKNYLTMRIISVFNIAKMRKKDILLSLAYLQIFYNRKNIEKISDLANLVKKL